MQVIITEIKSSNKVVTKGGDVITLIGLKDNEKNSLLEDITRTYLRDRLVGTSVKIELNHNKMIEDNSVLAYVYVKTNNNPEVFSMVNKEILVRGLCKHLKTDFFCPHYSKFKCLSSVAEEEDRGVYSSIDTVLKYLGNYNQDDV